VRPLVPAGALLLLCAATPALATPALAAGATPAAGTASSALGLLSVTAAGHTVDVATVELVSDTASGAKSAQVVVTPLAVDGTPYGQQTIGSGSSTVPALSGAAVPSVPGVLEVAAPAITASADDAGPTSKAGAGSLGALTVLGIPVTVDGTAEAVTGVTGALATSTKDVSVTDLSLPSVTDLLAGLGLDVSALPLETLQTLVDELGLALTGAVTTANAAVDAAQAQVDAAAADVTTATADLAAATAAVDTALATLTTALGSTTLAAFEALPQLAKDALGPAVNDAYAAYVASLSTRTAAQTALAAAQALVDTLQTTLATAVAAAVGALEGLLDGVPLLSVDSIQVATRAVASSAEPGGQNAEVVGGEVVGLEVLGTDVLDTVLGSSSVDVLALTDEALDGIATVVDDLTGTLAGVLSDVAGLELTAPVVDVLGSATRTGVVDGFGEAETLVGLLSVQLPRITLPTALQLPGVGSLPAFEGVSAVNGALTSLAGSVDVVTLTELSRFRPATTAAPTAPTSPTAPTLPQTGGLPAAGAGLTLLVAAGALVLLRRRTAAAL
jgi:hypothetical protein